MNTTYLNAPQNLPSEDSLYIPARNDSSVGQKNSYFLTRFKKISFSACGHLWSYLGKIALITRQLLNAAANNVVLLCKAAKNLNLTCQAAKDLSAKIKNITTHMKLLSIVSVIFSIPDLKATAQKMLKNFLWRDKEGFALGALTFTIIASDIFDSITTFVNASLTIASKKTIGIFSAIALPLGYIMSGLGTISRIIQIAKSHHLYRKIKQEVDSGTILNKDSLKTFLEKTMGIDGELKTLLSIPSDQLSKSQLERVQKLKEKNKAAILRAAPSPAVNELEGLLGMLEESSNEVWNRDKMDQALAILENVQQHLRKKMKVDTLGITGNLFSLAALILFTIGTSGSMPFLLLAIAFAVRLASTVYQNYKSKSLFKINWNQSI